MRSPAPGEHAGDAGDAGRPPTDQHEDTIDVTLAAEKIKEMQLKIDRLAENNKILILELEDKRKSVRKYTKKAKQLQQTNNHLTEETKRLKTELASMSTVDPNLESTLLSMERERAEVTQELLMKAHVMASHSSSSRRSPLKMRPSPSPDPLPLSSTFSSNPSSTSTFTAQDPSSMHIQDLSHHGAPNPFQLTKLALLHKEAIGQLKDISHRMDYTEAKLSHIDLQSSTTNDTIT